MKTKLLLFTLCLAGLISAFGQETVLMVVGNAAAPNASDTALKAHLVSYGYSVQLVGDSASTTADEIRASRAGRIVAPGDPEALAMAALSIAREWTAEDSQAGPAHVERVLSERVSVAQFESLLMDAVTKHREFAGRERVR